MTLRTIESLAGDFALFDDWEGRYRYLIDIGRTLPPMEESLKTDRTLVRGCTSRVWMTVEVINGHLKILADSDAHIVRGLIALILAAYQGLPADKIRDVPIEKIFRDIGLDEHLSPNRRSGFYAMVERVRALAASS